MRSLGKRERAHKMRKEGKSLNAPYDGDCQKSKHQQRRRCTRILSYGNKFLLERKRRKKRDRKDLRRSEYLTYQGARGQ